MDSDDDTHRWVGCPIRIPTDQSLLAAPHGFSQRATSFVASWCQGIHRMPFSRSIAPHAQKPATAHAVNRSPSKTGPSEPVLRSIHTHFTLLTAPQCSTGKSSPFPGSDQPASRCKPETHQPLHLSKEHLDTGCPAQHRRQRASCRAQEPDRKSPVMMPAPPSGAVAIHGGGGRDRTDDPLLAKQVLSQLSYAPIRTRTPRDRPSGGPTPTVRFAASWAWWAREDSNLRPHAYQACALTN